MSGTSATPGVKWPPPLAFLAALGAGYALHLVVPVPLPGFWVRLAVAVVLGIVGAAIGLAAVVALRRHDTALEPWQTARHLVTNGPFAWSRNPIYVSMTLLAAALGIAFGWPWTLVALIPVVVLIDRHVIAREEAHLAEQFGAAYDAYRRRTRRWV